MEASENPQLPIDGGPEGTVRALGDKLEIRDLTVTDERAARVVRERSEAGQSGAETVEKAIEIGARVLDSEETAVNVDYVRAELERQGNVVGQRLLQSLEDGDEAMAQRIAEKFDGERDGSVQKEIEEMVAEALDGQREAILKLLTVEDGSNPLFDYKETMVKVFKELSKRQQEEGEANRQRIEELTSKVIELREGEDADRRVAEEAERGTAKGFTFEEQVHGAIERIASIRGDCATHTGGEGAEGGGKKGDTLVELGAAEGSSSGRIVFEAKDKRLSKNEAWKELNAGMEARAAGFGVLVVAGEERVPARCEQLAEYEGNKMIVALDRDDPDGLALEVAYKLAAARVAMARDRDLQVDAVAVRDTAAEAVSLLKAAQAIRSSLTGIKTSSDRARAGLDEMVSAVEEKLERIEALVEDEASEAELD